MELPALFSNIKSSKPRLRMRGGQRAVEGSRHGGQLTPRSPRSAALGCRMITAAPDLNNPFWEVELFAQKTLQDEMPCPGPRLCQEERLMPKRWDRTPKRHTRLSERLRLREILGRRGVKT